tara:strand:- start:13 stop:222 length:210 start_codon:yes stop_codon:yes gene_type:complete
MNDKQKLRKKKARQQRIKTKLARRRKAKHYEDKRQKELWEINRTSEKEINKMLGTTYRKPKEISENTQD